MGRRVLHLTGLGGMFVMSLCIVVADNIDTEGAKVFLVAATLGFVVFFAGQIKIIAGLVLNTPWRSYTLIVFMLTM